jgi:hypothetical protein
MLAHDTLFVLVSTGMIVMTVVGWRIGRIMSPRPKMLRDAAAREAQPCEKP